MATFNASNAPDVLNSSTGTFLVPPATGTTAGGGAGGVVHSGLSLEQFVGAAAPPPQAYLTPLHHQQHQHHHHHQQTNCSSSSTSSSYTFVQIKREPCQVSEITSNNCHQQQTASTSLTATGLGTVSSSSSSSSASSKTMSSSTLTTLVKIEAPSPKMPDLEKSTGNSVPIGIAVARKRPQETVMAALSQPTTLPLQQPLQKDMNCFGIRVADLAGATSCGNLYFTGNGDLMTTGTTTAEELALSAAGVNRTPSTFWQYPNALPIESVISMSPATVGLQYSREASRGQVVLLPAAPAALGISNFPLLTPTDPFQQAAAAAAFVWPSAYIPQANGAGGPAAAAAAAAALQPSPNFIFPSMGGHSTLGAATPSYASTLQLYLAAAAATANQQTSSTTTTNSTINLSLAAASSTSSSSLNSSSNNLSSSSSRFLSLAAAQQAPMGSLLLPPTAMKLEDYSTAQPLPLALPPLVPLEASRDKEQALNLMRLPTPPTSATIESAGTAMAGHTAPHHIFQTTTTAPSCTSTPTLLNLSMHGPGTELMATIQPNQPTICDETALNFKLHAPLTPQTPPRLMEAPPTVLPTLPSHPSLPPQMQDMNIQTDTPVCSEDESLTYPCPPKGGGAMEVTSNEPSQPHSNPLVQPLELTKPSEANQPNECHTQTNPCDVTSASAPSHELLPEQQQLLQQQPPQEAAPMETTTQQQTAPEDLTGLELLSNISTNSTPLVRVKQEPMEHSETLPVEPPPPPQPPQPPSAPPAPIQTIIETVPPPAEQLGGLNLLCALATQRFQEEVVQGSSLFATPTSRTPSPPPIETTPSAGTTPMPSASGGGGAVALVGLDAKPSFGFANNQQGSATAFASNGGGSSSSFFQMPISNSAGFPSMQGIELPITSAGELTPVKRKKHKHSKSSSSDSRKSTRCSKKSKKKRRHSTSRTQQQQQQQQQADDDMDLQDEELQSELRNALDTMNPTYVQRFGQEVFTLMDNSMRMRLADITRQYRKKKRKLDEISKHKKKKKCSKMQSQQQSPVQQPTIQQPQLTLGASLSSVLGTSSPLRDYKFPKFSSSNLQTSSFLRFPEKTHSFPPPPQQLQQTQTELSPSPSTSSFVRLEPSALDAAAANAPTTTSTSANHASVTAVTTQKPPSERKQRKLKARASRDRDRDREHQQQQQHTTAAASPTEPKRRLSANDRELQLTSEHLYRDETRVLTDMGGLFYAGVMKPLRPPDVYAITLDGERGNKSHVMSREDILKDTILEVAPKSVESVPVGTRLCAYWSQQYRCLYPGRAIESEPLEDGSTVAASSTSTAANTSSASSSAAAGTAATVPDFVSVEFDDGDSGRIRLQNIRLLLSNYPIAEYNDNPLYSVGKQKRGALRTGDNVPGSIQDHVMGPTGSDDSHSHHGMLIGDNTTSLAATMELFTQRSEKKRLKKSLKKMTKAQNGVAQAASAATNGGVKESNASGDAGDGEGNASNGGVVVPDDASRKHHKHKKRKKHKKHHRKNDSDEAEFKATSQDTAEVPTPTATSVPATGPAPVVQRVKMEVKVKTEQLDMEEETTSNLMSEISDEAKGEELVEHNNSKGSSKIAAFLPERQLWGWYGTAYRKAGVKGRARKQFYKTIKRGKETITVGDSAVFLSTGRPDRPYIGRIESMWETTTGNKVVRVAWFYHPEETTGCPKLKYPGALFESPHEDENDVQTISHRCGVLEFGRYFDKFGADSKQYQSIYDNNDTYYLAGHYNPRLQVLKLQDDIPTLEELQDTNTTTTTTTTTTTKTTTTTITTNEN